MLNNDRVPHEADAIPSQTTKLKLPKQYSLVVGDTFELFYKGIIDGTNDEEFFYRITCSKGNPYKKKFIYTPEQSDIGTHRLSIDLYDKNHILLDSQSTYLVVKSAGGSPVSNINVLCVGDSLTTDGTWVKELNRRLTGTGGTPIADGKTNITFIGTCNLDGTHYEGYGGWTFNSYNTEALSNAFMWITTNHSKTINDQHSLYKDSNNVTWKLETIEENRIKIICSDITASLPEASGTLTWVSGGVDHYNIVFTNAKRASGNPFWNETEEKVDFATYAEKLNVSSIDYVYVLLGWNSWSLTEDVYKPQVQTFIDNVHADFPNCKIVLMGLQIPSLDGIGNSYGGTSTILGNYYDLIQFVHNIDKLYSDLADSNQNVSSFNISGQFDTEHNMPTSTRQVNTRNSEMETYQSNGLHPTASGYYQIADAAYRDFIHILQE